MHKSLIIFTLLAFLVYNSSKAQAISGKLIDDENDIEIDGVKITDLHSDYTSFSDVDGNFTIPAFGTYLFEKSGFISKTIPIKEKSFVIVTLLREPEKLEEIQITTSNFQSELRKLPTAIGVLSKNKITSNNTVNYAPILNSVSGVFMQNGTLNTNRITIRGIGSRSMFGTSKIRAYYQDIPLTNGSGESTIEDIEMNSLGRMEIWKGPSSSIYGAGLGGTIQMIPDKGQIDAIGIGAGYTFGSFGFKKFAFNANLGNLKNSAAINYSNTHSDGYRENNELDRQAITIASNHYLNDKNKLVFIGNYIALKAFIPSSLDEEDYTENPESAAYTWGQAKGYEDYKKLLLGLSWQHTYNSNFKQYTSLFTSFLDSYEPRPFNILKENTAAIGLRSRLISTSKLFDKDLKWTLGGEIFKDYNDYQTFENLYQDFPEGTGSVEGDALSHFREDRVYFNLFFDLKFLLSKRTTLSLGLNYNQTLYDLDDKFNSSENNFSGSYRFDPVFSPKIGVTHEFNKTISLYSAISHGFSPPTLEETLLPDGQINSEIKPESGWNFEIGTRGNFFNNRLVLDLAIYRMQVKNLLVARRTAGDEFIGVNAGSTILNGVEISLDYRIIESNKVALLWMNALTINDFKFKEFVYLENDYSGNDLTGVPNFTFNSGLKLDTEIGIYGFLNYYFVDEIPMRDDNSIYSEKYQIVHTKIGYKNTNIRKVHFDVYFGINNLFDQKYASMLLINAGSFGTNAPRYYYPGEPTNFYTGIKVDLNI